MQVFQWTFHFFQQEFKGREGHKEGGLDELKKMKVAVDSVYAGCSG